MIWSEHLAVPFEVIGPIHGSVQDAHNANAAIDLTVKNPVAVGGSTLAEFGGIQMEPRTTFDGIVIALHFHASIPLQVWIRAPEANR
jgi:hypothetical protein